MPKEFSDLISYLDEKFINVDQRLTGLEVQTANVDQRLTGLEVKFDTLQTAVDAYMKQGEAYFQEMLALAHKVDRMERWIHQIAQKTGVKLDY